MAKRDLINITDLTQEEVGEILDLADDMVAHPEKYYEECAHKKIATLFYEPSTRTRLSFESAMLELGGNVIGFASANSSSASKGESVSDTVKVIECYADIIAMRHPKEGAALVASNACSVPVINAGDGGHFHPTQTLTDLFTIRKEFGRIDNIRIGFCGDLKFGRTVHSLIEALLRFEGVEIVLISPDELKLPKYNKESMTEAGIKWTETTSLEDAIPDLDVLYMTRVQQERFFNEEDYIRLRDTYVLDRAKMKLAKEKMIVMHPLPRINEISVDVDRDPRAVYFKQVRNGKDVRKALIATLLRWKEEM
ncbi:MAG: aspartate carbamoyltransferase [Clostridia bacterium]|uniref:Aspartate carbamoyltransferase n=1 Tax=Mogibacterium kristiansenii TaxID=2606708 RepID=A0A6N7X582_9FIRM|nr:MULTISPECIES: aspartate carbamoyltransferase [Mogibacterium]MCI7123657.1 aspartate carbamoyltransferase [Mogibacterium sp.]MDY5450825.1 aspartate carbamoyltransferase [Clostridia bacterium]MEE0369780.1 aspartate carbamoyltransferase [Clostridia bacterium]MST70680.1 aspartate carbamoyltransferase [Mogibacterium kristiansenii]